MLVHPVGLADFDVLEPRRLPALELVAGQGAPDAPGPCLHVGARRLVHIRVGDDVGDGEPAAGPQNASGLVQHRLLVRRQVDDAVRDHDVDRVVSQRDVSIVLQELDVLDTLPRWFCRARSSISSVMSRP